MTSSASQRLVVIGAGITGLAAAHRVYELAPQAQITVLEAGTRAGGVLETVRRDGCLIEHSADNFITNVPWAIDLCRRIGLADQLLATSTEQRGALVVHRGKIERVPAGFMLMAPARLWPLVTTPLLSPLGKLRLLAEPLVPRRKTPGDESLASFARRRLGREVFDNIVQPLVGGIYTADPEKLSLAATLPRFLEMERKHGSLIRAARAAENPTPQGAESGVRYGLFYTLRDGMSALVARLVEKLPPGSVRLSAPVRDVRRETDGSWRVSLASGESLAADAVIVAVSAPQAARLLGQVDDTASRLLAQIEYAGTSIVSLAYRRSDIARPLDAFGFVVPAVEKRSILAGSFSSLKFAGRAPDDQVLIRVFIGGALQRELADLPDEELKRIATEELRDLIGARGEPLLVDIARWPATMPQYHVGHTALVASIEAAAARHRGLALAGSAYHGVGIPHCIHSAEQAAERVLAALGVK